MKTVLGIDPGMSGALAFYDQAEMLIYDMPCFEIKRGSKNRKQLDIHRFAEIVTTQAPTYAVIEKASPMPRDGAASAFSYGFGCGALEGVIQALKIPLYYVRPNVWKKALQTPADKDGARMRAGQLLPDFAHNWPLKKHDGRAEAALIAYYGFEKFETI